MTGTVTLGSMKLWVAKQNNVLHQIIQLFILLNACVLFTDMLNNYISTAHYLFLHYSQCVFVNFCHRFHFFHFISFHFLFTGVFIQFSRFFHRVLNFEIFSKFRLCKIHRFFHRVFSCDRVFHIFFTVFSQVFIQYWKYPILGHEKLTPVHQKLGFCAK